ncbi:hypothetical protein Cri9333_1628 [Crinalium epipsammum PCC 9333]|uniref:Uncharacterized protein n=2 Tax=Crinalium TaxID=241421 RepID=K9VWN3_9CYAN|nr:hypothetical protein Cri9333_1628 [Crinalium epipsammum PCC 9333]
MFVIYIPVVVLLVIIFFSKIPFEILAADPLSITKSPFYYGAISNIGVLFWCSTASVCFFCFAIFFNKKIKKEFSQFFLFSGSLTSLLLLDDLFLLHEEVFPKYLNVSEKCVAVIYGIIALLYLIKFRKTILKTEFILLILAFIFFGLSLIIDNIGIITYFFKKAHLLISIFKLLGIITWFSYFSRTCIGVINPVLSLLR